MNKPDVLTNPEQWAIVPVEPTREMSIAYALAKMNIQGGYDTDTTPYAAMLASRPSPNALQEVVAYVDRLEARNAELEAAKWQVRHVDTANDLVSMGMARDAANVRAEAAEARVAELEAENARHLAEIDRKSSMPGDYRYWEGRCRDAEARLAAAEKVIEPFTKYRTADGVLGADGKTHFRVPDGHVLLCNMKNADDLASVDADTIITIGHLRAARAWKEANP